MSRLREHLSALVTQVFGKRREAEETEVGLGGPAGPYLPGEPEGPYLPGGPEGPYLPGGPEGPYLPGELEGPYLPGGLEGRSLPRGSGALREVSNAVETRRVLEGPLPGNSASPEALVPSMDLGDEVDWVPRLSRILAEHEGDAIGALLAIDDAFGFLPRDVLGRYAAEAGVPLVRLFGIASFYGRFRLKPRGRHTISVCHGTACHVAGADDLTEALASRLGVASGGTTPDGLVSLETVACVGCCSLAPIVRVDTEVRGRVRHAEIPALLEALAQPASAAPVPPSEARPSLESDDPLDPLQHMGTGRLNLSAGGERAALHDGPASLIRVGTGRLNLSGGGERAALLDRPAPPIRVGMGSCGLAAGAERVAEALRQEIEALGLFHEVAPAGCLGLCHREVLVELPDLGEGSLFYGDVSPELVPELVRAHFVERRRVKAHLVLERGAASAHPILGRQDRIVLERCGHIDPGSLDEYRERCGFEGLERALSMEPDAVCDVIARSGLRGRGGGGFPTGKKWRMAAASPDPVRYVICNADEGDPGAFMDRNLIEGDPFAVLEGLLIAGYATGAKTGFVYVRHEYPLAGRRIAAAVEHARSAGWLGERIAGSTFCFDIELRRGAGAFVCGEETALIASLEGERGWPSLKPPYPTERGLFGHPTCINNVETLAAVPWILRNGADAFRGRGTPTSPGTKVFCLAGDVQNGGMVEVPMGMPLRAIIEDLGGGSPRRLPVKAVQIGGPSGGCLPADLLDIPVDYDALSHTGAMMGSGGLVVLDAGRCMVDVARYFVAFMRDESCGKCTACREGTARLAEVLERITAGEGTEADLSRLEALSAHVRTGSLCGLGKTAPNPVETTLRYFRAEYEAHVRERRCPSNVCRSLIHYAIDRERCDGCSVCLRACPVEAIHKDRRIIPLTIDPEICIRCDACRQVCPFDAVRVSSQKMTQAEALRAAGSAT